MRALEMDDPRIFPPAGAAPAWCARLFELAEQSLGADVAQRADACDAAIGDAIDEMLRPSSGDALAVLFASAPSAAIYRHVWRILARRERAGAPEPSLVVRLVAIPVIVVAGLERAEAEGATLSCVLDDAAQFASILRNGGALAGNVTLALPNTLVGAEALAFARLPQLFAWRALAEPPEALPPAPIAVTGSAEGVHLRFIVGTALAAAGADLFREQRVGAWGVPFAQSMSRALAPPGASVLALPRPPLPVVEAEWQGRLAQREVAAQIFASNAIRKLRAGTGEPSAVISVHATEAGAEVRLSLSSPFDPRSAEGFRCTLAPLDRVEDVVTMLETLMADCRVTDVRRMPGAHPDRDAKTGLPLLFKAEAAPSALH
jgi:hypothetical protein